MLTVHADNQGFSATHDVYLPPSSTLSEAQICLGTVAVSLKGDCGHALELFPFEETTHSLIVDAQLQRAYGQLESLQSVDFYKCIMYIKRPIILQLLEQRLDEFRREFNLFFDKFD